MAANPVSTRSASTEDDREDAARDPVGLRNLSKVTPPTPHRVHPNRRLFRRLEQEADRRIVWVHGPPGAGKTTLVASYLAENEIEPLWYRLDEADADPATLFFYLAAAWKGRKAALSLPLLTPEFRTALGLFSRRFFRDLFGCAQTRVLVFDDYHEVPAAAELHQCIASGLEEVPDDCRVIIVGRAPPPAALAKLRMNGAVDVIEPDALRLTLDEAQGVARLRGVAADSTKLGCMVQQTQGWAAGLILMLEAGMQTVAAPTDAGAVHEVLFDYFAGEILQRMAPERQHLLAQLALLPTMTAASAERLTGSSDTGAMLEDLRRRNYFTTREVAAEPRYRFHPLFRDFLIASAKAGASADDWRDLRHCAAAILENDGQADAAALLFAEAGDIDALSDLVKRRSASLVAEGRNDTVAAWMANIPAARIADDAWLSYWRGAARVGFELGALAHLERAFALFEGKNDAMGQVMAWAGMAEAIRLDAFGDNSRFDALIASLPALLARQAKLPPPVLLRVAVGMVAALSRRGAAWAEVKLWEERGRQAAEAIGHPAISVEIEYGFACFDLLDGRYAATMAITASLPDPLTLDRQPMAQFVGLFAHGLAMMYRQTDHECVPLALAGNQKLEAAGLSNWLPLMAIGPLTEADRRGDIAQSAVWLRKMAEFADKAGSHRGTHYYYFSAHHHLMTGNLASALADADIAVAAALRGGWYHFIAIARKARASVLREMADVEETAAELDRLDAVLAWGRSDAVAFSAKLMRADLFFARGDEAGGRAGLAKAMAFGREHGDRSAMLHVTAMSRICALALKFGIEPDYVRMLIRVAEVIAPDPFDAAWPWPIKITTFGGFAVAKDEAALVFSRKVPKRLILLLKAIITFGGRDVPDEKLADAIWPDQDGDAAQAALRIAVHRLRKLLGDPSLVVWKGGRLGLDPRQCWLDVWAFAHATAPRAAGETEATFATRRAAARTLYRGDFLAGEDDLWWASPRRDALREKYRRAGGLVEG